MEDDDRYDNYGDELDDDYYDDEDDYYDEEDDEDEFQNARGGPAVGAAPAVGAQ